MAEMASYLAIEPVTIKLTAVAVARGVRVAFDTSGTCAVAPANTRGEFVTATAGAASEFIMAFPIACGGKVPALASEATTVGALAYCAAGGKFSVTSASSVPVGKWTQAASGDGVLGEVQLFSILPTA